MFYDGVGPANNEQELVLFGPGYGEAIAIHLGDGRWVLVDSCIDPSEKRPAALVYLESIKVPTENVVAIVASHWHDDHVKGLSTLVASCSNAELFISAVFETKELQEFIAAYSGAASNRLNAGTTELYNAITQAKRDVVPTIQRVPIVQETLNGKLVTVSALSPTKAAHIQALQHFAAYAPVTKGAPINHVPALAPNLEAVVVHVDFGDAAILLGSDLEHHNNLGWEEITTTEWCLHRRKASIYKVAHHGSATAEHPGIWDHLLEAQPTSLLTPFIKGKVKLPKAEDSARIRSRSSRLFVSSQGSSKSRMDKHVEKQLAKLGQVSVLNNGFGAVRLRRQAGTDVWTETLFGKAVAVAPGSPNVAAAA